MAGKKNILDKVKGLFRKEQAPLSSARDQVPPRALPLSAAESRKISALLHAWVNDKGYRLPHRNVADAAAHIGTTSVLLHRYCINCLGQDFRAWRTALRIEDAKRMLIEDPDTPAAKIGAIVGITDRSNFFRQFMEMTGQSPDQWRKTHGTKD